MRRQLELAALAALSLVVGTGADCCGVGEPYIAARSNPYELCEWCAIAVGAEARVGVITWDPQDEIRIRTARLADPTLADIELFHGDVLVRPRAAGSTRIDTTLADGSDMPGWLDFADRATTITAAVDLAHNSYPPGAPQVYAGSSFTVVADHRDATNNPLQGYGLEAWTITGGVLAEIHADEPIATQRLRRVTAGDGKRLVVTARADARPLEVDIVPPNSATNLELAFPNGRLRDTGETTLYQFEKAEVAVTVFTGDGHIVNGTPPRTRLSVSSDNPVVVAPRVVPGTRRIEIQPSIEGTAILTVTFDGITRRFRIHVVHQ